jgi:redox-sensing transcriptional repressor
MSKSTIIRLSRYKNTVKRLKNLGFVKIFSDNIADAIGVTPSQVRKDFSMFGISGNKRGGYKVEELLEKLNSILGKDRVYDAVVAGVGNIGKALISYNGFEKENIRIVAAFDIDHSKCGEKSGIKVLPIEDMTEFIRDKNIKIGIIAVPDMAAQHVLDIMLGAGVKGVLNFAPIQLRGREDSVLKNINLALELENIIYFVNAGEKMVQGNNED